jgi:hypothetical protein
MKAIIASYKSNSKVNHVEDPYGTMDHSQRKLKVCIDDKAGCIGTAYSLDL